MTIVNRVTGDMRISGNLYVDGSLPDVPRSGLVQDVLAVFPIAWDSLRVWDAFHTPLPGTAAADDMALVGGTFGSASPHVSTDDVKAAGCTRRLRFTKELAAEYDAGQTLVLRLHAGMTTTPADTSATVDVECYVSDREGGVGADICATAAQSINTLVDADKDFTLTPTGLSAGDVLDVRVTVTVVDAATGTAVIADIGAIELLADIKG